MGVCFLGDPPTIKRFGFPFKPTKGGIPQRRQGYMAEVAPLVSARPGRPVLPACGSRNEALDPMPLASIGVARLLSTPCLWF